MSVRPLAQSYGLASNFRSAIGAFPLVLHGSFSCRESDVQMSKNIFASAVLVLTMWSAALAPIDRIDLRVEGMT